MADKTLYLVGLGTGQGSLPAENWQIIKNSDCLFLKTEFHPLVPVLQKHHIPYESLDGLYREAREVEAICTRVVAAFPDTPIVTYAFPGSPGTWFREIQELQSKALAAGLKVKSFPAPGLLEEFLASLDEEDLSRLNLVSLEAEAALPKFVLPPGGCLFLGINSKYFLSKLQDMLLAYFPGEHPITVFLGTREGMYSINVSLQEIGENDYSEAFIYSLYLSSAGREEQKAAGITPLLQVMKQLRGREGCPWDRSQTFETLKPYLIEEAYETLEALEEGNMHKFQEELGDLLLQVVFHACLAEEQGIFDFQDIVDGITEKMVYRHPHVFGELHLTRPEQVLSHWEKLKSKEKPGRKSFLEGVPRHLPALLRARRVQEKAARAGFDWESLEGPWAKIGEEIQELELALSQQKAARISEEIGDLLFAVVNVARFLEVDAEGALQYTVQKFIKRFRYIEEEVAREGRDMEDFSLEGLERLWQKAKNV